MAGLQHRLVAKSQLTRRTLNLEPNSGFDALYFALEFMRLRDLLGSLRPT